MPGRSLLFRGEEMIKITLNGIQTEVESGLTILDAAVEAGVHIPALCHYEGHENGTCRLCLVSVNGMSKPVPSCSTVVSDGMNISTETEYIREYRKALLAMLMLDHGTHEGEKEAKCRLHEYAAEYGIVSLAGRELESSIDRSHPGIEFDPSLCIKCGKCVIACNDEQGNDVIGFHSHGQQLQIEFDDGMLLGQSSCKSCGACVDVCPTGALIEKDWVKADRTITSICPYCAVGCTIEYGVRGNRIAWARGLEGIGVNEGKLCVKGKFGWEFNSSQDRLRTPLIRKEGMERSPLGKRNIDEVFREASWAEALELISSRLNSIRQTSGVESIGGIACDRGTNEDIYAFQKFMRVVIGNDNVDQSATLCHAPSAAMLSYATGAGSGTNPIHDMKNSRTIMVIGSNTDRAHPVVSAYIKKAKRNGAVLIVIDPRRVDLAEKADIFLQIRPGSDAYLFSSIAKHIIDHGLYDHAYVSEHSEGFEQFEKSISAFTPERAEKITGIPAAKIKEVAEIYATNKPSSIFWTLGITEHRNGSDNVSSLANLAILTGNIGIPGGGLNPLRGQNNVQGGADMGGSPGSLPGYQNLLDPAIRKKFESAWGAHIPGSAGLKSTEMTLAILGGSIRAMYISGENSIRTHPNTTQVTEALKKLDFLLVQDIFMTETAEFADVVLPAASTLEKDGTFTNTERRVQLVRKVLDPPGEAKPDWLIYAMLAEKMGKNLGFRGVSDIDKERSTLVPSWAGLNMERLEFMGLQWPVPSLQSKGTEILHIDGALRGKARFRPITWADAEESEYPYVLITGRLREQYHTATMTSRSSVIADISPDPSVEMNPGDMQREGISENDMIELMSTSGLLRAHVRGNTNLQDGVMFTTFHFHDLPSNVLTTDILDPITKTPAYKDTRVKIVKVSTGSHYR